MVNAVPAVLFFAITCLFVLSTAFPSGLNEIAFPQAEPNTPRTLLGKAYRRCSDSQSYPPLCWIRSLADRNDSGAITSANTDAEVLSDTGGCTSTEMEMEQNPRVQMPLPLVLNGVPEFRQARLRLVKSKTPSIRSPCSNAASVSNRDRADRATTEDEDALRVQSLVISEGPKGKTESRKISSLVGRSKRLYGRGEWKSRLLEEY